MLKKCLIGRLLPSPGAAKPSPIIQPGMCCTNS